ncbi:MAG: hypothetical protein JEZ04_05905 [Spirochaetales bacterium]|nr:hypothetical protein [Spirochaetales bacterium]
MKFLQQFSAAAAMSVIIFFSGCTQLTAPLVESDVLTYLVDCSERNLLVDVTYLDGGNKLVKLSNQVLPWSITITMDSEFTGDAYLKAEIPQADVFVPFISGTAGGYIMNKLSDLTADFTSFGVITGDIVYIDPSTLEGADVMAIDDANTLSLKSDLFPSGNESYYIYHEKTLTSSVLLNDVSIKEVVSQSERSLSCLVQTSIAR